MLCSNTNLWAKSKKKEERTYLKEFSRRILQRAQNINSQKKVREDKHKERYSQKDKERDCKIEKERTRERGREREKRERHVERDKERERGLERERTREKYQVNEQAREVQIDGLYLLSESGL